MRINSLIVDEISLANTEGYARTSVYHLADPTWISTHAENKTIPQKEKLEQILGPITILDESKGDGEIKKITKKSFRERRLHTEVKSGQSIVSFVNEWTLPADMSTTLYTSVLPRECVASQVSLEYNANTEWNPDPLRLAVSPARQLFFYTLFQAISIPSGGIGSKYIDHYFTVKMRIKEDSKKYSDLLANAEAVEGTRYFKDYVLKVGFGAAKEKTVDFWLKLLELATKISGLGQ